MKKYTQNSLSDIIGTTGSMLLFMLFAVCMLIIISAAASTYGRIKSGFDDTFCASASLRYVTNKLRSADSAELLPDGSGLIVTDGGVSSIIYSDENGICEKSAAAGEDILPADGSVIFKNERLSVTDDGELYIVTVTCGGENSRVYVRKGDCSEQD